MHVVIAGNGIIALTTAYRLIKRDPGLHISLIGPFDNKGCASLAAAAMFNSFCEVDAHTLSNKIEREKWLFNKSATPFWPSFIKEIETDSGVKLEYGFGTYLINNHTSDDLEDENFEAILSSLKEFKEPFEFIKPTDIKNYKPSAISRAARAIYIGGEGWINPILLMNGLKTVLKKNKGVNFINDYTKSIIKRGDKIDHITLESGKNISGDIYVIAPGAAFSKIIEASNLEINFLKIFYGLGCSLLLKTDEHTTANCIRTPNRGLACGLYSAPQDIKHTLVGASNLILPWPEENARVTSVYTLLKSAMEQLNSNYYKAQLLKVNVGWRPTSEDTLPLLGKTSIYNLLIATGTKRDGLHCSPVISNYLSDLILTGNSENDLSLYNPERKPVRFITREEAITISVRHTINAAYQHDFVPPKNNMVDDLEKYYRNDLEMLHDKVGAVEWGIPPELINMYRYNHIS